MTKTIWLNSQGEVLEIIEQGEDYSPQPVAHWVQFAGMLATDPAVNQLVATAAAAAPVLHLMLGVGLGQAAQGEPATFLAAWDKARSSGLVSELVAEQVAAMAAAFDLPTDFVGALS